jgi:diaminopimelate epimerase
MKFEKYHGCGNDFLIVLDEGLDYPEITKKICNRNTGFGADGLIVAGTNPLKMMLYNQDGSIANMCGNGIRTLACYYVKHKLTDSDIFTIETLDGPKQIEVVSHNPFNVKINMGTHSFDKEKMGFTGTNMLNHEIVYKNNTYITHNVFLGTYHTIVYVDSVDEITEDLGKYLMTHKSYKYESNIDFVEVVDENNLKVRTYERGIGFTKACGTGSSASYVISKLFNKCNNPVNVILPYGTLKISEEDGNIYMEGPATFVGSGEF